MIEKLRPKVFPSRPWLAVAIVATLLANFSTAQNIPKEMVAKIDSMLPETAPAKPKAKRKVLIFTKTRGFRHGSIPVATKAITMLGKKTGAFEAVHSEDMAMFEPDKIKEFDAIFFVNTTGEVFKPHKMPKDKEGIKKVLETEKRLMKSLVDFVKSGKGIAGTHSATDTYKNWKEYNDMMGGAFMNHPWHTEVPVRLLDANHPLNKVFGGKGFKVTDEIYQFRNDTASTKERRMLLSLDPNWKQISKGKRKDGVYAISWIDKYESGRIFYCSLGHRNEIYWNPAILEHYLAGFQFVLGDLDADAEPLDK